MVNPHGVVGRDGAVEEGERLLPLVLGPHLLKNLLALPEGEDLLFHRLMVVGLHPGAGGAVFYKRCFSATNWAKVYKPSRKLIRTLPRRKIN